MKWILKTVVIIGLRTMEWYTTGKKYGLLTFRKSFIIFNPLEQCCRSVENRGKGLPDKS